MSELQSLKLVCHQFLDLLRVYPILLSMIFSNIKNTHTQHDFSNIKNTHTQHDFSNIKNTHTQHDFSNIKNTHTQT